MQKLKVLLPGFIFLITQTCLAQQDPAVIEYINTYKDIAISEMIRTGVPAAIKLAQGIHETEAGTSKLVKKSNNHFGIKCKSDWKGMSVRHTDDAPHECFRKYENAMDSYKDHSDFLKKSPRYALLFELEPTDYEGWAYGLKKAGYATNSRYPQILIKLIEDYHLQDYSLIALGKLDPADESLVKQQSKQTSNEADVIPTNIIIEKPVVMEPEQEIVLQAKKPAKKDGQLQQMTAAKAAPVYPDGEFKINDTKVVYVRKGTPYLTLAEQYNIPLARIFEFNEMKQQEMADKDQLIFLMRKRKTGANEQHIVQEGEALSDIAQAEAIRIESLLELNYLKPGMKPAVGSVLYLKSKAPSMPALAGK